MAILNSRFDIVIDSLLDSGLDIGNGRHTIKTTYSNVLSSGTGADQANAMWSDTRQIAASTTEDLDLFGGLTDAFGVTMNFANIKLVFVKAAASNTNDVVIGGDANSVPMFDDVSDAISIKPGGVFMVTNPAANGYVVTNSTGDVLQVANSSSGSVVDYDIIIIGEV